MNLLAIETSSSVLSVAVKAGRLPTHEEKVQGFLNHAENLMPKIGRLLRKARLKIEDIDIFLIGRGPGSFTGLRIGFSTLKGFLSLEKKETWGALSLDLIAENSPLADGTFIAVCLDAHRQMIYSQIYRRDKGVWIPSADHGKKVLARTSPQVLTPAETVKSLPGKCYVTGDALLRYGNDFQKQSGRKKLTFLPEAAAYPAASTLIQFFERRDDKLARLEKPADFIPLYFRLSEPEERLKDAAAR